MLEVETDSQPIELYKLLKIADLVSGGGEAKMLIHEGYVLVNGEVEWQKRKKIFHGDFVEFNGEQIILICHNPVEEVVKKPKQKPLAQDTQAAYTKKKSSRPSAKKSSSPKNKRSQALQSGNQTPKTGGRKRISFS